MGKIVVTEFVSLDGVIEAPGGGEDYKHAGWTFEIDRGEEGDKFKLDELVEAEAAKADPEKAAPEKVTPIEPRAKASREKLADAAPAQASIAAPEFEEAEAKPARSGVSPLILRRS